MYKILRGGCNTRHPASFIMNRPDGVDNYVLLIIKTKASFTIDGKHFDVSPDSGVILSKKTAYSYRNPYGEYIDDWIHFCVEDEQSFLNEVKDINSFFKISDSALFSFYVRQLIFESLYTDKRYASENVDHLMQVLLNHIKSSRSDMEDAIYSPYYSKLRDVRVSIQSSMYDNYSAAFFAKKLGISLSHFQHLYKQFFGVSFQQDSISMRINYAKDLLETTDLSMDIISEQCGYKNTVHFYRQFKATVGQTPANYRKHFRNLLF